MQNSMKRIILALLTVLLCMSGTMTAAYAQTDNEALQNAKQQLQQKQRLVEQKQQEQQSVNQEIEKIQQELQSIHSFITKNQEQMAATEKKIAAVQELIEKKKEEIVALEDNILGRRDIMKKRAVALQQNDSVDMIINLFFESDSIADFIQRASAASTLIDADKNILIAQKEDLQQIENDKKEIDAQEQVLEQEQSNLAAQQQELNKNMQKRQSVLANMQKKYEQIAKQVKLAEQEKAGIQSQLKDIQAKIKQGQDAAKPRPVTKQPAATSVKSTNESKPSATAGGKEMYVSATAYTPYDSGSITALGYNIKKNPNMKLIAVDPRVIPLGKKVWVEGYGVAIAGDTGGAIKGHKIDILLPTKNAAYQWGRRTVKVIVLN
ncbi:3D domain-containing protein [Neobacillus kokaensis]|uniref:Cell wall-binding protein n=1 Tax=Neobacillus kokaensis TaxID=2759023 RepID=A0ABQ3NA76_9BACI|nr:3D domain-containing protein [Neobacillus kokaensis]GHH98726.1 cell wall-binding protein [Neobacillus kokaensis]